MFAVLGRILMRPRAGSSALGGVFKGPGPDLAALRGILIWFRADLSALGGILIWFRADFPALGGIVLRRHALLLSYSRSLPWWFSTAPRICLGQDLIKLEPRDDRPNGATCSLWVRKRGQPKAVPSICTG